MILGSVKVVDEPLSVPGNAEQVHAGNLPGSQLARHHARVRPGPWGTQEGCPGRGSVDAAIFVVPSFHPPRRAHFVALFTPLHLPDFTRRLTICTGSLS